jgi:hypothetical protein
VYTASDGPVEQKEIAFTHQRGDHQRKALTRASQGNEVAVLHLAMKLTPVRRGKIETICGYRQGRDPPPQCVLPPKISRVTKTTGNGGTIHAAVVPNIDHDGFTHSASLAHDTCP